MFPARPTLVLAVAVLAALTAGCGTETDRPTATAPPAATVQDPAPAQQPARRAPTPHQAANRPDVVVRLSYSQQQVRGDTGRVEVPRGSTVGLVVTGATADEVHVHGYDRTLEVPAKGTARLIFTADIPGVFEIELHDAGSTLTRLAVR